MIIEDSREETREPLCEDTREEMRSQIYEEAREEIESQKLEYEKSVLAFWPNGLPPGKKPL